MTKRDDPMSAANAEVTPPVRASDVPVGEPRHEHGQAYDWPFEYRIVHAEDLEIDDAYQRPLGAFVNKIVDDFMPALIGTLIVNHRGKKLYVIDGQHRLHALKILGIRDVPCVVYQGLSRAEEAELFAKLQTERRRIRPSQRFQAEVVAKNDRALAIKKVLDKVGVEITDVGGRLMAPNEISAVVALERIYDAHGVSRLEEVLTICRLSFPEEKGALANDIVLGVSSFIATEKPDPDRLVKMLNQVTAWDLKARATALRQGRGVGGGSPAYMAEAIASVYRRRRIPSGT
jgi:hypothetical protein